MEQFTLNKRFAKPVGMRCVFLALFNTLFNVSAIILAIVLAVAPLFHGGTARAETVATNVPMHPWLGPELLSSKRSSLQPQLTNNAYGEPFYLSANVQQELTTGDVYANLPYAYNLVAGTLLAPQELCTAIMLHINVKGCVVEGRNKPHPTIDMYVGRKEYQNPENAFKVSYAFKVDNHKDNYTLVSMIADKGPLHTENIALYIECIPIDDHSSFIHFTYSANYGGLARFALNTYLATLGRKKVGFTSTGQDKHGDPIYIKGIQGVVERNTMRYFFALESFFYTYDKSIDSRLNRWFDYVEKYPEQLYEVTRDDYLKAKHHELLDTEKLQLDVDAS